MSWSLTAGGENVEISPRLGTRAGNLFMERLGETDVSWSLETLRNSPGHILNFHSVRNWS